MGDSLEQQKKVVGALKLLAESLKELKDSQSSPQLSHYRVLPEAVKEAYDVFYQGAQLIHATSTKYTLLGKLDVKEQTKAVWDMLKGCQLVGTACVLLHDDQTGCARPTRQHSKRAARAIVLTVTQLIEVWVDESAQGTGNNIGAQKTGAVWEKCNFVLEKRLPQGNRTCMRRDLFTYTRDCVETIQEFQDLIDQGPSEAERKVESSGDDGTGTGQSELDILGSAFTGEETLYSPSELAVATSCLSLLKISRGCLNFSLESIENLGAGMKDEISDDQRLVLLSSISRLFNLVQEVGRGVTELGASLYPPLRIAILKEEVERQIADITSLFSAVDDVRETLSNDPATQEVLSLDTRLLISKVKTAFEKRRTEATEAVEGFTR